MNRTPHPVLVSRPLANRVEAISSTSVPDPSNCAHEKGSDTKLRKLSSINHSYDETGALALGELETLEKEPLSDECDSGSGKVSKSDTNMDILQNKSEGLLNSSPHDLMQKPNSSMQGSVKSRNGGMSYCEGFLESNCTKKTSLVTCIEGGAEFSFADISDSIILSIDGYVSNEIKMANDGDGFVSLCSLLGGMERRKQGVSLAFYSLCYLIFSFYVMLLKQNQQVRTISFRKRKERQGQRQLERNLKLNAAQEPQPKACETSLSIRSAESQFQ